MPKYVEGVELTQEGMHAIFKRMGHPEITSGKIYNRVPEIDVAALNRQGFMPVLTGVGPTRYSGHWIMLIKGQGNQYYLFDPLGQVSGTDYRNALIDQLQGASLTVIPNDAGYNMGLCGYWVASVGLRARAALNQQVPVDLPTLGQNITNNMRHEADGTGYLKITAWLRAVGNSFPEGAPQPDATALRQATAKQLNVDNIAFITTPKTMKQSVKKSNLSMNVSVSKVPAVPVLPAVPAWNGYSLYTDNIVRNAAKFANAHYLSKPYTGPVESQPTQYGGITVNRYNHGLAHTLRTMSVVESIVEEARKAAQRGEKLQAFSDGRTLADVTPNELQKVLIAQAFFVAGRDDEESTLNYAKYHQQSREAFLRYVNENKGTLIPAVFKDEADVNFYADIVEDKKVEGKAQWNKTPSHLLVNQGHMVDLVRCKMPAESALAVYFQAMQPWLGTRGTEAVFAVHRRLLKATGELVPGFYSDNKDVHVSNTTRHLNRKGRLIGVIENKGRLFNANTNEEVVLQPEERFLRVDEYLAHSSVKKSFPGYNKSFDGENPVADRSRGLCETNVDYCLGKLQAAHHQAKIEPLKSAIRANNSKARRPANADEIAAADIIRQILAEPGSIKEDHVLLSGQKLEEPFFRTLLARCDMAIVGSLLNDQDILHVDGLMAHEQNTIFHEPGDNLSQGQPLGEQWNTKYRTDSLCKKSSAEYSIKMALIYMMQDGAWYYRRLNAVAQGRDSGSTFKEVVLSALMIPTTNKALADVQPLEYPREKTPPKMVHKGLMNLPSAVTEKLLNQAQSIIANTTMGLFSDTSTKVYQQIKINQLSSVLAKTCSSTSGDVNAATIFTNGADDKNNIRLDIEDPDGLLDAKRVGRHGVGAENEYSVYVPDDVALIPIEVTKGSPHIIHLIAVKSPDFMPRHEAGYAVTPFIKLQDAQLATIIKEVNADLANLNHVTRAISQLGVMITKQTQLPVAGSNIMDDVSRFLGGSREETISLEYKNFLEKQIIPVLQAGTKALIEKDMNKLKQVLAKFPAENKWPKTKQADPLKIQINELNEMLEKKMVLQNQVIPFLTQCHNSLEQEELSNALQSLVSLPSARAMGPVGHSVEPKIDQLLMNLTHVHNAMVSPKVSDELKMKARYDTLMQSLMKQINRLEEIKPTNVASMREVLSELSKRSAELTAELNFLRNEKVFMHRELGNPLDFTDIESLEGRVKQIKPKLIATFLAETSQQIAAIGQEKPTQFAQIRSMMLKLDEQEAAVDFLRKERSDSHGASQELLDMSDLDTLKASIQGINQHQMDRIMSTAKKHLKKMDVANFDEKNQSIQECYAWLIALEKKLDNSEAATKQREDISKLHGAFLEKHQAFLKLSQVKFQSEALIMQLRDLCDSHYANQNKINTTKISELSKQNQGITAFFGRYIWGTPTTNEHSELNYKQETLTRFRAGLHNSQLDLNTLIINLGNKNPSSLAEGLGISIQNATTLQELLKRLQKDTLDLNELQERSNLIDNISTILDWNLVSDTPVQPEGELQQKPFKL